MLQFYKIQMCSPVLQSIPQISKSISYTAIGNSHSQFYKFIFPKSKNRYLLQLQIYKKSHFYSQALDKELYSFVENVEDNMVSIYIVWGISLKDRSDCHFSSIACRGKQVYDSSFDPNPEANQMALKV